MMYLERHGAPLPHGTIPLGASETEILEFKKTLRTLTGASSVVTPEGFGIGFLESARTAAPGFEEAIAIHNGALDRSQMVPQLMGLSGGRGSGGSYGLGKTQYDVFIFYQEFLGLQLEDVFQRHVIKPLVDLNFLNVKVYPKFQFASIRRETRKERAAIIQMLAQSGVLQKIDPWIFPFIDLPIPSSALPEAGTPIVVGGNKDKEIDDDRDNRPMDDDERSVVDGTNPHVDKSETDVTTTDG
jgi:phage gp29-like protein